MVDPNRKNGSRVLSAGSYQQGLGHRWGGQRLPDSGQGIGAIPQTLP
jgi:hypothetical protein